MKKTVILFFVGFGCLFIPAEEINKEQTLALAKAWSSAVADTVEEVMPSVVTIRASRSGEYLDFWTREIIQFEEPVGQGSGFIIRDDGYILTNHHVVRAGSDYTVTLYNGKSYRARFVGGLEKMDVAVLKIDAMEDETFKPLKPGDSDALRVGEFVLAIGAPFNLEGTVTEGIISHKGRASELSPLVDFIQTSAPINPGNSGGPLVDIEGKLIGINTFIQTANPYVKGSIGIGFAVPGNRALAVANSLIAGKKPRLNWLGISMAEAEFGVVVAQVFSDSPAERGGLKKYDVIVAMDNTPIRSAEDLHYRILKHKPGTTVEIKVIRGWQEKTLQVVLDLMPEENPTVKKRFR